MEGAGGIGEYGDNVMPGVEYERRGGTWVPRIGPGPAM